MLHLRVACNLRRTHDKANKRTPSMFLKLNFSALLSSRVSSPSNAVRVNCLLQKFGANYSLQVKGLVLVASDRNTLTCCSVLFVGA